MILAIDVGNTQTVAGVFRGEELVHDWRIRTVKDATADEMKLTLTQLLAANGLSLSDIDDAVVSSVVPDSSQVLQELWVQELKREPVMVGPGLKTGMPILYDNPKEVGADRIVNSVAALHLYGPPVIIVDFGTATTFDAVSAKGEYVGGAIAPGIGVSAEALFAAAAQLPEVDFKPPRQAIGKNTRASIQSGLIYGSAGLVDTLVGKLKAELSPEAKTVATGGLAKLIVPWCRTVSEVNPLLTLTGLREIYRINR